MRRLYEHENWTLREIAAKYGLTYQGVHYRLVSGAAPGKQTNMRRVGGPPRKLDREEVRRLYVDEGLPIFKVARLLRTEERKVKRELDALGIEVRPPGSYNRMHPEISRLKIGGSVEIERGSSVNVYQVLHGMARNRGMKISVRKIGAVGTA
jgi:hypothetical protein